MSYAKKGWTVAVAILLALLLVVVGYFGFQKATTDTVTAYFKSTTGLYEGDPVRVLGVNVGRVVSIDPLSDSVRVKLRLNRSVDVPADAKAVIVAQSLVSGRFIQLAPVYTKGPKLVGGTDIPMERTAIPMEWDDLKTQLTRLTEAVGPDGSGLNSPATRLLGVADENLRGNGEAINKAMHQLSKVAGTLSSGRDDLFSTIRSLQDLTEVLSTSHEQLVQFNGRIATVSGVLSDTAALNGALVGLDSAMSDLKTFLDTNGAAMSTSIDKLATATTVLRQKDEQLRGLLHSGPTQLSNFYNIYNPMTGSLGGIFGLGMGANLITLLCGTMEANNRPGQSMTDVDRCVDVLAPVLKSFSMNYPPFMTNPVTGVNALPNQLEYQNADVKQRAQARIRQLDAQTRKANNIPNPLGNMLVPFGAEN